MGQNLWHDHEGEIAYYGEVFYKLLLYLGKSRKTFQNKNITLFD